LEGGEIAARGGRAAATALVAALVFVLAAPVGAKTSASPELTRLATAFRGVPVVAECASSPAEWSATLAARHVPAYVVGFAYIGNPRVWLSPSICAGVPKADPWAVLVFLHELIHTSGVRTERTANCRALARERQFLVDRLGLSSEQAQSVYEQSFARALAEPPAYRPVSC
jgi:hypothetical protein